MGTTAPSPPVVDEWLVAQVEKYRTGAEAHRLAEVLTIYRLSQNIVAELGNETYRPHFDRAETELRAFVARRRQETARENA